MWRKLSLLLCFLALAGCGTMNQKALQAQANSTPVLNLEEYFSGTVKGYGVLESRNGTPQRSFVVTMRGTWDAAAQTLTLDEDFIYNDGEKAKRIWTMKKTSPSTWDGTASDVIGVAKGVHAGRTLLYDYVLAVPVKGKTINLRFKDVMQLQPDGKLLARSWITKFGFRVAELTIFFEPA